MLLLEYRIKPATDPLFTAHPGSDVAFHLAKRKGTGRSIALEITDRPIPWMTWVKVVAVGLFCTLLSLAAFGALA